MYRSIIVPRLPYEVVVRWAKTSLRMVRTNIIGVGLCAMLDSMQAFLRDICSASLGTPSAVILFDIPSKAVAMRTSYRLRCVEELKSSSIHLKQKNECPVGPRTVSESVVVNG